MNTSVVTVTQPVEAGPYMEALTAVVVESSGSADASKIVMTSASGTVDASLVPAAAPPVLFGAGAPSPGNPGGEEGQLYFDTSVSPFAGYVWHGALWNSFS